ncbi:ADP-forming succinate--CoA ligase subunit beta [Thermodesulfobacteriota bacterium]
MKLHEFQAKEIFSKSGISIPKGQLVTTAEQAAKAAQIIPGSSWMVKAQVHAGGRGKGGGVRAVHYPYEVVTATESMLGKPIVTEQTGPEGVVVDKVLIEEGVDIEREFYLSMVVDRSAARPVMIFSQQGGMDIEDVAANSPDLILKEYCNPATGWMPFQAGNLVYKLDPLPYPEAVRQLMKVMESVYRIFITLDCSLVEINPLVITRSGRVIACDGKINIDDNALFKQKELLDLDDPRQKDPLELMARKYNLNYIRLDGNIGAMVNGAGLAMATMDVIKMAGSEPANFLDVGGGANEEMITKGIEIILEDPSVKAVLVNIFGGILRCDVLARGVLAAAEKTKIKVPLIVRLEGTNEEEGRKILRESNLDFLVANNLAEVAELVANNV